MNEPLSHSEKLGSKSIISAGSFLYQVIHTICTRGFILIIGVVTGIVTARVLNPEGKGLIAMFHVLPGLVEILGELGIRQSTAYLIGQKRYDEGDIQASLMALCLVSTFIGLAIVLIGYWILGYFQKDILMPLTFALVIPIVLLQRYANGLLLGRKQIEKMNYINIIDSVGTLILIIVFTGWLGWGVTGAGMGFLIAKCAAVALLLVWVSHYSSLTPRWVSPIPEEMIKKGIMYAASLFMVFLNYRIDVLMLGKMQGSHNVGIYSVGVHICELIKQMPFTIGIVLFSHSTNWTPEQEGESLSKTALLTRVTFIFSLLAACLVSFFAWWLVPIIYGVAFRESVWVVWCLMPGVIILTPFIIMNVFAAGQGKPELALYAFGPALLINVILNYYWIPRWSYIGAASASIASYSFAVILYMIIFNIRYKVKLIDFFLIKREDCYYVYRIMKGWRAAWKIILRSYKL